MQHRPARVVQNDPLTPTVRRLVVTLDSGPFEHAAGQAVILEAKDARGESVRAPYSIASAPHERGGGTFEVAVARDAAGSSRSVTMHGLPAGSPVAVVGPIGSFVRAGEALTAPGLFVAAGTGLSPLRAMIADELARRPDGGPPLVLLFGARTADDVLWADDVARWTKVHPRFRAFVTLSRPEDAWTGLRGHVQAHLGEAARAAGPDAFAYVCGPEAMVTETMSALTLAHLPAARVLRERYG